jgi:hypothetical protein
VAQLASCTAGRFKGVATGGAWIAPGKFARRRSRAAVRDRFNLTRRCFPWNDRKRNQPSLKILRRWPEGINDCGVTALKYASSATRPGAAV